MTFFQATLIIIAFATAMPLLVDLILVLVARKFIGRDIEWWNL